MASLRVLSIAAPPLLLSLFACGIGDGENLFGKSGSGENGDGGAGAVTASSTSSDVGASTSDGGSPSGPGPGPSSSRASSVSSSSSRASSSSSSGGGIAVDCGQTECKVENQSACCWDNFQLNGPPQGECVQGSPENDGCDTEYDGMGNGAETRIECQLPSHCKDGEFCCGDRVLLDAGSAYYATTSCQASCDEPDRILCDPLAASDLCPLGTFCVESQLLPPGYFICSNP